MLAGLIPPDAARVLLAASEVCPGGGAIDPALLGSRCGLGPAATRACLVRLGRVGLSRWRLPDPAPTRVAREAPAMSPRYVPPPTPTPRPRWTPPAKPVRPERRERLDGAAPTEAALECRKLIREHRRRTCG